MKVLITGTSQGIGRAICQLFLDKGHEVIGFDKNEGNMISDNYTHYQIDIRDYDKLPEISGVNILINNAGTQNEDDIDINSARKILGDDKIIGISTHKPDDAIIAQDNNADYIGVGPVFKTPTKPNTDPVGLEYVKWVKNNIRIPFYAIGSIDENNISKVVEAGATKVAAIRALMDSSDINMTVKLFSEALNHGNN